MHSLRDMFDFAKLINKYFKEKIVPNLVRIFSSLSENIHPRIYNMKIIPWIKQISAKSKNNIIIKSWKNFISKKGLVGI
jgi:hypothetical protein